MGQIDSSFYSTLQGPDFLGNAVRMMSLKQMMQDNSQQSKAIAENEALKGAFGQGIKQDASGKQYIDQNATLSALAKVNPVKAYEQQKIFEAEDIKKQKTDLENKIQKIDLAGRLLSGVNDQESFDKALATGQKFGFDTSQLGKYYDPNLVKRFQTMSMTTKENLDAQYKQLDYELKERAAILDDKRFASDDIFRNKQLAQKERELDANRKSENQKPTEFEKERQKLAARDFQKSQQNIQAVNKNMAIVDDAINSLKNYSNNTLFGTGPIATGLGLTKYTDQATEDLNAKLKAVNLRNMTTTFAGMSKAVDSNAERLAWQGTQADVSNDDLTNMNILLGQKSILLKDKAEAKAQREHVLKFGNLDQYQSPIDGKVKTMVGSDGELILVPNDRVVEASKSGYYDIDEYSRKALQKSSSDGSSGVQRRIYKTNEIDWL